MSPLARAETVTAPALERWLFDVALPFWSTRGVDADAGGFVERLTLNELKPDAPFKRMRVQARQAYVFSHAAALGWSGPAGAGDLAGEALRFMERGWSPERGWARLLSRDGRVLDATPDLYDAAFVLFALGWRHRVTGEPALVERARETLSLLAHTLPHPSGRGFAHEAGVGGPWLQNPHMHLLEAMLALAESTGEAMFADEASRLVTLFQERFFDEATGTLVEHFDDDWRRLPDRRVVEPGHHYEWAWLLFQHRRIVGDDATDEARALTGFADAHGRATDPALTLAEVCDDGRPLDGALRVWPQTESIKAQLALMEHDGAGGAERVRATVAALHEAFVDQPAPGVWIDRRAADGAALGEHVPASTLYHVMLAYAEALRLRALWSPS